MKFTQQRKFERISYLCFSDERADRGRGAELVALPDDRLAYAGHQHDHDAVEHRQAGYDRQTDEPEPQQYVDLLVDDVEREHAHSVERLNAAGRTVLVEGALGDAREYRDHRIEALLLIHVAELDHLRAVRQEGAAQEDVYEEYVANLRKGETKMTIKKKTKTSNV